MFCGHNPSINMPFGPLELNNEFSKKFLVCNQSEIDYANSFSENILV